MTMTESQREGAIAILGMSGRFPGARNVEEYWQNIRNGVESLSTFSREELLAAGRDSAVVDSPRFVARAGVLDGIEQFDAGFFGMNPREAEVTDPQQRLFLECAWQALEDAGYDAPRYDGAIGVFAGSVMSSYLFNLLAHPELMATLGDFLIVTSNDKDHLATRVSYKLNLRGPSVAVQTACSTSLVAVCMACQSLLDQQCDMALAGGVAIRVPQTAGYLFQEGMIYSPDGHCRPFAEDAAGTLFSNGMGLVVLKRLNDAVADGDTIHAVIRGWATNNDGARKVGYTAPSPSGQAEVIAMAQAMAEVEPRTIGSVEAHGTATSLGDPLEISALTEAFRLQTAENGFCAIGSVKGNIGHLDAAAGVAGLIKVVQALRYREIPPSLHCEMPNPAIDFARTPFFVNTRLRDWPRKEFPRRAGVSAFGIGGTNAHLVLEEWDETPSTAGNDSTAAQPSQLLVLSARSEEALDRVSLQIGGHLQQHPELALTDVAWTLQAGRHAFNHRRIALGRNLHEAADVLQSFDPGRVWTGTCTGVEPPIVFLFPGQGSQYVNMGRGLYQSQAVFRDALDECAQHLLPHLGLDIRTLLYPASSTDAAEMNVAAAQLSQTRITQPALCAVEIALARLVMDWGLRPQAMIGHSVGEYVAAHLAGVFSLADVLALVAERGRLIQQQPLGAMLAIPLSVEQVRPLLSESLHLAAMNEVGTVVISGPLAAVDELSTSLAARGLPCQRLETSHAFHSAMMDPVLPPFRQAVERVRRKPPMIPYVTNLGAEWATAEQATSADYWVDHLRQPVRFAESIATLLHKFSASGGCSLLEVGPGRTLTTLTRRHPDRGPHHTPLASMRHALDSQEDVEILLTAVGRLWISGTSVDWPRAAQPKPSRRVSLPTYPFERQRYWVDAMRPDIFDVSRHPLGESAPKVGSPDLSSSTAMPLADEPPVRFAVPSWRQASSPESDVISEAVSRSPSRSSSHYLILEDELGVGARIAMRLRQLGHRVIAATAGTRWEERSVDAFTMDVSSRADYEALIRESLVRAAWAREALPREKLVQDQLDPNAGLPEPPAADPAKWGILHLFTLDASAGTPESEMERGFYSLTLLAQALEEQAPGATCHITIVSNGLHAVIGGEGESVRPAKAALLGACRVIPEEYPLLSCRSIDLSSFASDGDPAKMCAQVMAELRANCDEPHVAYRNGRRWVERWETVALPKLAASMPRLRENGVYLITGGLGGLGLAFAKSLAQKVHAKLVLVSRTVNHTLADDPASENEDRLQHLDQVEELGGEVMLALADVADAAQMEAVVSRARARFGTIHGVIHAAGIAGGGLMQLRGREAMAQVFRPKVQGTMVLAQVLGDTKLDFFVLCSSLTALRGEVGQADYTAANVFLDGFAQSSYGDGRNVISINWDLWQEVGMGVHTVVPKNMQEERARQLSFGLRPEEGADALLRILGSGLTQVAVSKTIFAAEPGFSIAHLPGLRLRRDQGFGQMTLSPLGPASYSMTIPGAGNASSTEDEAAPAIMNLDVDVVESRLAEIWTTLLGVKKVNPYDNFFELGGHSLLGNRLILLLRSELQVELPMRSLFEVPTFAGMVERIRSLR